MFWLKPVSPFTFLKKIKILECRKYFAVNFMQVKNKRSRNILIHNKMTGWVLKRNAVISSAMLTEENLSRFRWDRLLVGTSSFGNSDLLIQLSRNCSKSDNTSAFV